MAARLSATDVSAIKAAQTEYKDIPTNNVCLKKVLLLGSSPVMPNRDSINASYTKMCAAKRPMSSMERTVMEISVYGIRLEDYQKGQRIASFGIFGLRSLAVAGRAVLLVNKEETTARPYERNSMNASYTLYCLVCENNDAARDVGMCVSRICETLLSVLQAFKILRTAEIDERWRAGALPVDTDYIDIDFREGSMVDRNIPLISILPQKNPLEELVSMNCIVRDTVPTLQENLADFMSELSSQASSDWDFSEMEAGRITASHVFILSFVRRLVRLPSNELAIRRSVDQVERRVSVDPTRRASDGVGFPRNTGQGF